MAERPDPFAAELARLAPASSWSEDLGPEPAELAPAKSEQGWRENSRDLDEAEDAARFGDTDPENRRRVRATPFVLRDPRTIPPRRWLYGRHFIRRYATATVAPGGLGKSSLELVEALAMVTGRPLLGTPVPQRLRVWYWNGEDPAEEIERRVAAICLHYGIRGEEIAGRLFIDSGRELALVIAQKFGDQVTVMRPLVDEITAEIRTRGIDAMIIDPFIACHAVPENDNGAIDKVTKTWAGIAEACDCGIELVHHVRKPSGGQSTYTVEDARGGSALIGAVRSARVLNVMSAEEAGSVGITPEQRRRFFRVDDGKSNMQPPADRTEWRELISVGLGNANEELPEDRIGVVATWTMPGILDGVEVSDLRAIQLLVAGGTWAHNTQASNWVGHAVAQAMKLNAEDPATVTKIRRWLKIWIENGALRIERIHDGNKGREKPVVVVGERV